jgi:hypothetical protein
VRECLLESIDFSEVIENALLMLDFGVAAHEEVYAIDGSRVRIRKLATRLPVTFYRWIVDDRGELLAIEQVAPDGRAATIPASQLAVFTFQREGGNFAGRSLLRPMYQHWYIKANLYKIDAIACERNGMGVPWIQMGEQPSAEDRQAAFKWLQALSTHERSAIQLPPGWKFGLEGVKGNLRSAYDSIVHHNAAISMAALAQFLTAAEGRSGDHAESAIDFFGMSIHAIANEIAGVLNRTAVRRLVDFNFAGVSRYPKLIPQHMTALNYADVVSALKELALVGVIQPDAELERWLRGKLGMPQPKTGRSARRGRPQ